MEHEETPGRTSPPAGPPGSGGAGVTEPPPAAADEAAEATTGRKRGPHPDSGQYMVLAAAPIEGVACDEDGGNRDLEQLRKLGFYPVWIGRAEGQREAKQAALDANPDLKAKTEAGGDGLWLLAPPLSSARPKLAKEEQPPPIMRGL